MEDESRFAEQAVFPSSLDIPCWILDIFHSPISLFLICCKSCLIDSPRWKLDIPCWILDISPFPFLFSLSLLKTSDCCAERGDYARKNKLLFCQIGDDMQR